MCAERESVDQWLEPYDDVARFMVFVEQLEVAVVLATSGRLAQARMALVAADHLAELLVTRHAERSFASSERSRWMRRDQIGGATRERIRRDFARKIHMARHEDDGPLWVAVPAILDEADAALFRLAHSERNDVYHEDRHNPALLTPLTWLYLAAVARAFCRQYRPGSAVGGNLESRVAELARLGYELPEDEMRDGMFEFHAAAKIVTETLVRPLRVDLPPLANLLITDLQLRLSDAARIVKFLLDEKMPFDRLTFGIYWSQFWEACGADERAQEFEDRREEASEALVTETDQQRRSELEAAHEQANDAYIARSHELQRSYKPAASLDTMKNVGSLAPRLRTATTIRSLLERYERLDIELRAFENSVAATADGWSEGIELAIDAARER